MQAESDRKDRKARHVRNLIVTAVLSTAVVAPFITQPVDFGMNVTPKAAAEGSQTESLPSQAVSETTDVQRTGAMLEPVERILIQDDLIHRQRLDTENDAQGADAYESVTDSDEAKAQVASESSFNFETEFEDEDWEPIWLDVDFPLYVEVDVLNLREKPTTDSEVLARLNMATRVDCSAMQSEWVKVVHDDVEGYAALEYLSRDMVFAPVEQTRYVDASSLNMRQEPSTDSEVIHQLSNMTKVTRIGAGHDWSRVRIADGQEGYVASEYLTAQGPPPPAPARAASTANAPANPSGSRVVDIAYQALGVRYVYAGSSMSGMDCSGYTSWVYRQIGITLPRSSSAYTSVGTGVSYSNAQPGDILVMDTRRRNDGRTVASHVGIYIGGGRMIHASTSNQQITTISVNAMLNWGARLISVRRIGG